MEHVSTQEDRSHERRFYRADVNFPVTIIVPGHELVVAGDAVDISKGGVRVTTTTELPPGQPIVLRFTLPGSERDMLVRGKVALSFFDAAAKRYAHGVAFTQYTSGDHERISAFIAEREPTA